MPGTRNLYTYSRAAEILGTDYRLVSRLVRAKKIRPKETGLPGRAARTGLSETDIGVLRAALAPVPPGADSVPVTGSSSE